MLKWIFRKLSKNTDFKNMIVDIIAETYQDIETLNSLRCIENNKQFDTFKEMAIKNMTPDNKR